MPRTARNTEEVDIFKQSILDAAVAVIIKDGFAKLSMRKIAAQLGVTATTIYNYYQNKDELYFYIRIRGFELLHQFFEQAYEQHTNMRDKMSSLIKSYIEFGMRYPDYYEVMFLNRMVPKFLDCVGTHLEDVAAKEKAVALKPFLFVIEKLQKHLGIKEDEAYTMAMQMWVELNGLVSLVISRLLKEVTDRQEEFINEYIGAIVTRYVPLDDEWN